MILFADIAGTDIAVPHVAKFSYLNNILDHSLAALWNSPTFEFGNVYQLSFKFSKVKLIFLEPSEQVLNCLKHIVITYSLQGTTSPEPNCDRAE